MKFLFLSLLLLSSALQVAYANIPQEENLIGVKMQVLPLRKAIVFQFKNNTNEQMKLMLRMGENLNVTTTDSARVILEAGEEKNTVVGLEVSPRQPLLVVDYRVEYQTSSMRISLQKTVPTQYFILNTQDGSYRLSDARALILAQKLQYDPRSTRTEPTTLDLGNGIRTQSSFEPRAFIPPSSTAEEQAIKVIEFDAPSPKIVAEILRTNDLPGNIAINRPSNIKIPLRPKTFETKALSFDKDGGCDHTGLNKCFGGQLKIRPPKIRIGSVTASWGWTVELWQNAFFGYYKQVGTTETDGAGKWMIKLPKNNTPDQLKVVFKPINRFIQIIDPSTNKPYQFSDTINAEEAKTSLYIGAAENGVAKSFDLASRLWVRLTNGKINSVRDVDTYKIIFPNTLTIFNAQSPCVTTDATTKVVSAWSCSIGNTGVMYVLPEHATADVIVHELGHAIHRKFWKKFPADSGGDHSISGCYTTGVALTEGFADFLAAWAKSKDYNDKSALFYGHDIETYATACIRSTNEMSVAATFWDLFDTQNESKGDESNDSITYYSDTNTIADFLSTGLLTGGMPSYAGWLADHHKEVEPLIFGDLFRLNGTSW